MSKYTAEQAEKEADALLLAGIPFGRAAGMLLAYANLLRERDQPRGLGDGTSPVGATIRCHKCGEETKIAFNYGHAIEGCCNQSPCARPGVGPCNRPAAPMVRAILDGRKTVTRRIVKECLQTIEETVDGNR